jgi:hypothetical protein
MTMLRRYWTNQTTTVSLEALYILARLFKVDPGELVEMPPEDRFIGDADEELILL